MRTEMEGGAGTESSGAPGCGQSKLDLQDWLLFGGVAFSEGFLAVVWWPSALALAAAWCIVFVILIERSKRGTAGN